MNAGVQVVFGGFFGGNIVSVRPSLNARYAETFNVSLMWARNDIDLPGGSVVTNLVGTRVPTTSRRGCSRRASCSTTTAIGCGRSTSVRLAAGREYGTVSRLQRDGGHLDQYIPTGAGRSLILKYSYLFDLLD